MCRNPVGLGAKRTRVFMIQSRFERMLPASPVTREKRYLIPDPESAKARLVSMRFLGRIAICWDYTRPCRWMAISASPPVCVKCCFNRRLAERSRLGPGQWTLRIELAYPLRTLSPAEGERAEWTSDAMADLRLKCQRTGKKITATHHFSPLVSRNSSERWK